MKIQYLAVMLIGLSAVGSALAATDTSVPSAVSATTATTSNVTALFAGTSSGGDAAKAETALGTTPGGQAILEMPLDPAGKLTLEYPDGTQQVFVNSTSARISVKEILKLMEKHS